MFRLSANAASYSYGSRGALAAWVGMGKLRIFKGLAGVVVVAAGVATPAGAQYATPAFQLALVGGDIVGSAFVCGIPQERTVPVGQTVLAMLGVLSPAERVRAQEMYGAAVQQGATRQRAEGEATCTLTVARFDALEAQFVNANGGGPAPEFEFGFQPVPPPLEPR